MLIILFAKNYTFKNKSIKKKKKNIFLILLIGVLSAFICIFTNTESLEKQKALTASNQVNFNTLLSNKLSNYSASTSVSDSDSDSEKLNNLTTNFTKACTDFDLTKANKIIKNIPSFIVEENKNSLINANKGITLSDPSKVKKPLYVNNILLVNKDYALPASYNPGNNKTALNAFNKMKADAAKSGISLGIGSSFRSYKTQVGLYKNYSSSVGSKEADTFSATPGHSEHQSGLSFDIVGKNDKTDINSSFDKTKEASWLKNNAYKYGFILRYPKNKSHITGYKYESWHYRYIGPEHSKHFNNNNLTLEEYLGLA